MSTVSGFASIDTSASSRTANRSRTCMSTPFRSATSSVVGVPPPKKIDTTSSSDHAGAARPASASNARTYRGARWSRPAYALKSQ